MDESLTLSREDVVNMLRNYECSVVFTKRDGTERRGVFTLREDILPKREAVPVTLEEIVQKPTRKVNPDVIAAWDVEKSEWRSFRLDSLKGIIAMHS